jgi:DNA polymerase-3 subunit beta
MNFTTNVEFLYEKLSKYRNLIDKNTSHFHKFLFFVEKNTLKVFFRNNEQYVLLFLDEIKEEKDLIFSIDPTLLLDILNSLDKDSTVNLNVNKNLMYINKDQFVVQVIEENKDEIYILNDLEETLKFEIDTNELINAIKFVKDAICKDEMRFDLNGICLEKMKKTDYITIVATSGKVLSKYEINIDEKYGDLEFRITVPKRIVPELLKFNSKTIEIVILENFIKFRVSEEVELISNLIEGNFINYQRILPEKFENEIQINKAEILKELKKAKVFSKNGNNISPIRISISDSLIIHAKNNKGEFKSDPIKINKSLNNAEFSINVDFLMNGISTIESDQITLLFSNNLAVELYNKETFQNIHLIALMRTQNT